VNQGMAISVEGIASRSAIGAGIIPLEQAKFLPRRFHGSP
jgi:hypothetical protein